MHNTIITADDFGIGKRANEKILELAELGKLQRVGIMVHGIMTSDEMRRLIETKVSLDVHLDILHQFGDERHKRTGKLFSRVLDFFTKLFKGKVTTRSTYTDWKNQIELFRKIVGKNPDGINSHEHIHFFPTLFTAALKLREEYQIEFIRLGKHTYPRIHTPVSMILSSMRMIDIKRLKESNATSTDYLLSIDWIKDLESFRKNRVSGTTEIVCHPELKADFDAVMQLA